MAPQTEGEPTRASIGPLSRSRRPSTRPDRSLCSISQLPGDLDRLPAQHQLRSLEQHLVLRRTDLCLDDLNGEILALTGDQSRDAIVDARSSLVGIHARHRSDFRLRRNVSGRIREYPLSWADMAATLIGRATDVEVQSTALAAPRGSCCDPARPRACRRLRSLSHTRRLDQTWRDGGAVAEGCLRVRTRGSSDVPP